MVVVEEVKAREKIGAKVVDNMIAGFKDRAKCDAVYEGDLKPGPSGENIDEVMVNLGWILRSNGLCPLESNMSQWREQIKEKKKCDFKKVLQCALDTNIYALDRNELVGAQADLEQFFEPFDQERTGKVSRKVFRSLMENVGEHIDRQEVDEIINEVGCAEQPGDLINYKKFLATIMLK